MCVCVCVHFLDMLPVDAKTKHDCSVAFSVKKRTM
jgi:hypothetical protein